MHNEEHALRSLNEKAQAFQAWVVAPIPNTTTAFHRSWLLLIKPPDYLDTKMFPNTTDRFHLDVLTVVQHDNAKYSLTHLPASRIPNPFESVERIPDARVAKFASFKVDVPRAWKNPEGEHAEIDLMDKLRMSQSWSSAHEIELQENEHHLVTIEWDVHSATFEAELAALRFFTEEKRIDERRPTQKAERAFQMIQNFHSSSKDYYDLSKYIPQLRNPAKPSYKVPPTIIQRFVSFNQDQVRAFQGLQRIPNGVYFVNGCPGSGKTEWNMILAAIVQARNVQYRQRKFQRILFLVDINKTVDDAAKRYYSLCKEAGMNLRIVRMHGWPLEMRQSSKLQSIQREGKGSPTDTLIPDFTSRFLTVAGLSKQIPHSSTSDMVPTLDEASWQFYEKNKSESFPVLQVLLKKMEAGDVLTTDDWKRLRRHVSGLYRAVLARTDFIATTPVAACGRFSRFFRPDIVFMDEAAHARELTTLIPLAYFSPKAWIFTGDAKQTQPFVKDIHKKGASDGIKFNPFSAQLRLSTIARADHANAMNSQLLINRRAHGNLHRLPSALFYDGRMTSSHASSDMYPDCVSHLRDYLQRVCHGRHVDENRVIVDLLLSKEERLQDSFWNPFHHEWVLEQVSCLLRDPKFSGLQGSNEAGTIMIATPYSAAFKQYKAAINLWPDKWHRRVQVLTVDRAQGNESDVVFLDLVRTESPGFMVDPRRLNVAITRARQAEIIMMRPAMAHTRTGGRSDFLSRLWEDTKARNRVITLSMT